MFYNDFILVFIEKYQQKYQQNILLPTKKPIFCWFCWNQKAYFFRQSQQDYDKITAKLPTDRIYYLLRQ